MYYGAERESRGVALRAVEKASACEDRGMQWLGGAGAGASGGTSGAALRWVHPHPSA